jgi:hypothetical protein
LAAAGFTDIAAGGHDPFDLLVAAGGAAGRFAAEDETLEVFPAFIAMIFIDWHE